MKLQVEERKVRTGIAKNENKSEREERRERAKLEPWGCYIVFQPQSLQIYFKSKPINKIKSAQDKIRFDKIKSR